MRTLSNDENLAVGIEDSTLTFHDLNYITTTMSGSITARYFLERDRDSVVSGSTYLCQTFEWDVSSSLKDGGDAVGFMVARVDKNKGYINVLLLDGTDRITNATSNKLIVCMEKDVTVAYFLGEYGLVPPHGGNNSNVTTGDGNVGNNSNVITVTTNVIDHENNCE